MEASSSFEDYVPSGLAALGIEVDDVDLAVLRVAHGVWWPGVLELINADLSAVRPEHYPDLSRSPDA
jgi:hypothetical protein